MEVVVVYYYTKKLVNRGFLVGPVCPIYAFGCLSIILLLNRYKEDIIVLFVMAIVLCSIIEYLTSYLMEKFFGARWWDYSDKKFNVNGRICLINCIAFGFLGVLIMHFFNPFLTKYLNKIPNIIMCILVIILNIIFFIDNIVSFKIISGFKNTAKSINKDNTEEITKKVRTLLIKKGGLYKRLVSAFDFKASERLINIHKKIKNTIQKVENNTKKVINKDKKE